MANALMLLDNIPGRATQTSLQLLPTLPIEQWARIGERLGLLARAVPWWVGDWLLYGERSYGEKYAQFIDVTGLDYDTLRAMMWVGEQIPIVRRRTNLSWSHHREVAALKPKNQDFWLDLAEEEGLSRQELRHAIKKWRNEQLLLNAPPIPEGVYNVIYADPPWEYRNVGVDAAAESHYPTMSLDQICNFLSAKHIQVPANAVLFLWVTNPLLRDAFEVVDAWGFEYKANISWHKTDLKKPGTGWYVRGRHELLLVCTRGIFTPLDKHVSPPIGSVITAPVKEHSQKPEEAYEIIERLYPKCNYLELFARNKREGWTSWGIEL